MDTFDGSVPNLVSSKTLKDIESRLDNSLTHTPSSNKVINGLGEFYSNYISPNLFPLIVIGLLVLYLTIKYIIKRDKEEKNMKDPDEEFIIINKLPIKENKSKPPVKEASDLIPDEYLINDEPDYNSPSVDSLENDNENEEEAIDDINSINNVFIDANNNNDEYKYNIDAASKIVFGD